MIHSVKFTVLLDTNVIYPLISRDILFWFAHYDLYTPKWSEQIFEEWERVMLRKGIQTEEAERRIQKANSAFPDAMVHGYQSLIRLFELPDEGDRHVLAAAVKANAHLIVTNNVKDFPESYLRSFGLQVKMPDEFLTDLIDLNPDQALLAFHEMVQNKKSPRLDEFEMLQLLRGVGLLDTANYLHSLI